MKKLLLVTLSLSCFLFAGCSKKSSSIGNKISNNEALKKIDSAEILLNEKQYKSEYNSKFNEKTKVNLEYEKKISFDIDEYYENSLTIENDGETCLEDVIYGKWYGKSKGKGTDWCSDSKDTKSLRFRYNAESAQDYCDNRNKESYQSNYNLYVYKDNGTLYSARKNNKYPNPGAVTKNEVDEFDYTIGKLNRCHFTMINTISIGFEENYLEAYENKDTITIKLASNYSYGELDKERGLIKEPNTWLGQYFQATASFNRAFMSYYLEDIEFSITISFNKDGSYSSIDANHSFKSKYINYYCSLLVAASDGALPRFLKESYANSSFTCSQKETFTYPTSKIKAPTWLNNDSE